MPSSAKLIAQTHEIDVLNAHTENPVRKLDFADAFGAHVENPAWEPDLFDVFRCAYGEIRAGTRLCRCFFDTHMENPVR
jgi:hypothetical protein